MARQPILYIQHATSLGGSVRSLLLTTQCLANSRFRPIIAIAGSSSTVAEFYRGAGLEVVEYPRIGRFHFSTGAPRPVTSVRTWVDYSSTFLCWRQSQRATVELVDKYKPAVVHLNSMCLSPSAFALAERKVAFVWHVRESPPRPLIFPKLRTAMIGSWLKQFPSSLVFLSESDRRAWVGSNHGRVIPNCVGTSPFRKKRPSDGLRRTLGIGSATPVILYLGGLRRIKGLHKLITSLRLLEEVGVDFRCLLLDCVIPDSHDRFSRLIRHDYPLVGPLSFASRQLGRIRNLGLGEKCVILPFQSDVQQYIEICDLVVFPSIEPHFARPIIEAAMAGKPSIGSDIAGVRHLIADGETGCLVPPGSSKALAESIFQLLQNKDLRSRLGEAAYFAARERFSCERMCTQLIEMYEELSLVNSMQ